MEIEGSPWPSAASGRAKQVWRLPGTVRNVVLPAGKPAPAGPDGRPAEGLLKPLIADGRLRARPAPARTCASMCSEQMAQVEIQASRERGLRATTRGDDKGPSASLAPRPHAQRTGSTPRVRPSGAASQLDPSHHSSEAFSTGSSLNGSPRRHHCHKRRAVAAAADRAVGELEAECRRLPPPRDLERRSGPVASSASA